MGWHMWQWADGPGWGWMMVSQILWWVVLAAVAVAVWRWATQKGDGGGSDRGGPVSGEDSAVRLLRERYARGEIDQAEFEERRRHLAA